MKICKVQNNKYKRKIVFRKRNGGFGQMVRKKDYVRNKGALGNFFLEELLRNLYLYRKQFK